MKKTSYQEKYASASMTLSSIQSQINVVDSLPFKTPKMLNSLIVSIQASLKSNDDCQQKIDEIDERIEELASDK